MSLERFSFFHPAAERWVFSGHLADLPAFGHGCRNLGTGFGRILVVPSKNSLVSMASLDVAVGNLRASFLFSSAGVFYANIE
jgi:hypothetical protein